MIIIKIPLRPASKKNNRRNFRNISLPSEAYIKFNKLVAEYLLPFSYLNITKPCRINVNYFIKGKYHQDIDNALGGILDSLVDYKILSDDDLVYEINAKKSNGNKDWLIEIEIEEI